MVTTGSVRGHRRAETAAAYAARADEYVTLLGAVEQMAEQDRTTIEAWAAHVVGPILDAGCGPGHRTHHDHPHTADGSP